MLPLSRYDDNRADDPVMSRYTVLAVISFVIGGLIDKYVFNKEPPVLLLFALFCLFLLFDALNGIRNALKRTEGKLDAALLIGAELRRQSGAPDPGLRGDGERVALPRNSGVSNTQKAERILVVDDEEAIRGIISSILTLAGYQCRTVTGGPEALALLESGAKFDLMLTDLMNPLMDGLSLLVRAKERFPDMSVVVASAVRDDDAVRACIRSGACDYLFLPFEREQLLVTVRRALEHRGVRAKDGR